MGTERNERWKHSIILGIELDAPDATEAGRRLDDTVNAMRDRFTNREIYTKAIEGRAHRLAGHPRFSFFVAVPGVPIQYDPFADGMGQIEKSIEAARNFDSSDVNVRNTMLAQSLEGLERTSQALISIIDKGIQEGWLPSEGQIATTANEVRRFIEE
jgi:hypothetical protein